MESEWKQILEERRRRINHANVSEAAKTFYREHIIDPICPGIPRSGTVIGGWRDDYSLIKELDDAGLIMTSLVVLDHDKDTVDCRTGK